MRSARCWPRVTAPACEPKTPDDRREDSMDQRPLVTPRDRVVAAYKGGFADRVPAYPIAGSFAGCLDGLSIEEYCTNPTKAVRAMLNYYERYQPDIMIAFNDLAKEAEAIGCHVKYSDYVVPSIDQHVLQDDKGKLARLEVPDPFRQGRLPAFLEQCEALSAQKFPSALGAVLVGPWTIAMLMRNPELMCLDTLEDPEFGPEVLRRSARPPHHARQPEERRGHRQRGRHDLRARHQGPDRGRGAALHRHCRHALALRALDLVRAAAARQPRLREVVHGGRARVRPLGPDPRRMSLPETRRTRWPR